MAKEKKKKKPSKIKKLITPKKIALLMAIISLVSFLYKIGLGVISNSMILIIASLSTAVVCACKFIFWKDMANRILIVLLHIYAITYFLLLLQLFKLLRYLTIYVIYLRIEFLSGICTDYSKRLFLGV